VNPQVVFAVATYCQRGWDGSFQVQWRILKHSGMKTCIS